MAPVPPLFDQTAEVLSSLNWSLMRLARRPLPFDPRHPQACREIPPRNKKKKKKERRTDPGEETLLRGVDRKDTQRERESERERERER